MFDLQKKTHFHRLRFRNIDREIEPFFSILLIGVCGFMSVMLFGAGSFVGGLLFLAPVAVALHAYWEEARQPSEDEG